MTAAESERLAFNVDTGRILQILNQSRGEIRRKMG